jgi:hypothetical protein
LEGSLTGVDVQRRYLWKSFRAKSNTIPGMPKSVRLPPGILFAFIPERCSESARKAVRLHPGTPFAFARNPHLGPNDVQTSIYGRWTDLVAQDPLVIIAAGRSCFRVQDLLELCCLIEDLKRNGRQRA